MAALALSPALLIGVASADDLPELKARGVLRVIAQKDEAPELFNLREGEPGFEREVIDGFAKLHGLTIEPVVMPTAADRIPALNASRGDLIIGIVAMKSRPGLEAGLLLGAPGRSAFAIRKSDAQLLAALDEYLGNFRKSPSWNRLLVKYFGDQALAVLGRR